MEPYTCGFSDLFIDECGYQVNIHLSFNFFHGVDTLRDAIDSWTSLEIDYSDEQGEQITYCPGCGHTFTVQGRIEQRKR